MSPNLPCLAYDSRNLSFDSPALVIAHSANPTAQALYSAASAASLALRTLPATSDSTPMVVHNHKGVIEVSDSRLEMAREEEEQRRQEELDRTKRKRDRDYDESAMGVLEKSGRAAAEEVGAVKRRRSDGAGEREEAIVPRSTEIDQPFSMKSLDDETSDERGGLDPDFAMEFNEFLTDDAIHGTTSADVYEPPLGGGSPFRDLDRGGSPFRDLGPLNGADEDEQAMFDFFVDEPKQEGDKKEADAPALGNAAESSGKGKQADSDATKADNVVTESKEVKAKRAEDELLSPSAEVVWRGEVSLSSRAHFRLAADASFHLVLPLNRTARSSTRKSPSRDPCARFRLVDQSPLRPTLLLPCFQERSTPSSAECPSKRRASSSFRCT